MDDASGNLRRGEGFKIYSSLACGVKETKSEASFSFSLFFWGVPSPQNGLSTNQVWSMFSLLPNFFYKILPPQ